MGIWLIILFLQKYVLGTKIRLNETILLYTKLRKEAEMRNQYNQVPYCILLYVFMLFYVQSIQIKYV